jgi:uncharacterized protein YhaN
MKLRTIHVEGFGLLREKTLQLEGPLTVLYGRNEAGKSTLMGFIRAVLFGFPPRPGGAGSLEPLMGAAHGGYLTLETSEGERIRVERREGAPASAGRGMSASRSRAARKAARSCCSRCSAASQASCSAACSPSA